MVETADDNTQVGCSLELGQFRERRNSIKDALTAIRKVAERLGAELIAQDVHRTIQTLAEERFKVVVVGHFSQGKSTVINALLGTRLLPSSPRPTTAILNRLRHSDQAAIHLRYIDGSAKGPLDVKAFQSIVAPAEPTLGDVVSQREFEDRQRELRRIAFAEVKYPWVLCGDGVEIIDTPGTNDLDPMREKITYDFIPESDAAIFVLSARAVAADSEIRFLKDRILRADIQRIFFVINFADVIARHDRSRVVDFARTQLAPIVPEPRLFLVSARAALAHRLIAQGQTARGAESMRFEECGYPEFERALGSFLAKERGWIKLAKPREHGLRLAAEIRQGPIAVARACLGIDVEEFTARIERLEPEIARLKSERNRALQALGTGLAQAGTTLSSILRQGLEDIADCAVARVATYEGPLETRDLAEYIEGEIAPRQTALHEQMRCHQIKTVQEECSRAQRRLASAWDKFYIRLEEIFDPHEVAENAKNSTALVKADGAGSVSHSQAPVAVDPTANDLSFWAYVGIGVIVLVGLPFIIFDSMQRDRFLGRVRFEIDRRYRSGIAEAVRDFERRWKAETERTFKHFEQECNQNLGTLEDQLTELRDNRRRETGRAEGRLRELNEMEADLERAAHILRAVESNGDIL